MRILVTTLAAGLLAAWTTGAAAVQVSWELTNDDGFGVDLTSSATFTDTSGRASLTATAFSGGATSDQILLNQSQLGLGVNGVNDLSLDIDNSSGVEAVLIDLGAAGTIQQLVVGGASFLDQFQILANNTGALGEGDLLWPDGFGAGNGATLITMDVTSTTEYRYLIATAIGTSGIRFAGLTADVELPLPEPRSIALLGLGIAGLGFVRRRRFARR